MMSALIKTEQSDTLTELEVEPVARRMADAYWRALKAKDEGNRGPIRIRDKPELLDAYPDGVEWRDLACAEQIEPGASVEIYNHIKQAARDELESGHRAAIVIAGEMRPYVMARYLALRDSFIADWKPTGSIEKRLIEMMAHQFSEYEHWMELSVQRVAFQCEQERYQVKERGKWREVSTTGDADAQQAAEMADRFNRSFLRTLRQLRDLRRYIVPVIVQNAEQVNIAADGGQQVNVQKEGKKKARRITPRGRRLQAMK